MLNEFSWLHENYSKAVNSGTFPLTQPDYKANIRALCKR